MCVYKQLAWENQRQQVDILKTRRCKFYTNHFHIRSTTRCEQCYMKTITELEVQS